MKLHRIVLSASFATFSALTLSQAMAAQSTATPTTTAPHITQANVYCDDEGGVEANHCDVYIYGTNLDSSKVNRALIGSYDGQQIEATINEQESDYIYAETGDLAVDCENNENRELVLQYASAVKKGATKLTQVERFFVTPELSCEDL